MQISHICNAVQPIYIFFKALDDWGMVWPPSTFEALYGTQTKDYTFSDKADI